MIIKIFKILRLEQTFTYILTILITIYFYNLNPLFYIDLIFAFICIGWTSASVDSIVDEEDKIKGIDSKYLWDVAIFSFICSIMLMLRLMFFNPFVLIYYIFVIVSISIYGLIGKYYSIINQIFSIIAHIILPYLIVLTIINEPIQLLDILIIVGMSIFGLMAQIYHEVIQEETYSLVQKSYLTQKKIALIISFLFFIGTIIGWILISDIYLFLPLSVFALLGIKDFAGNEKPSIGMWITGATSSNIFVIYLLVLIFLRLNGLLLLC
jgi:hypothetical protein